MGTKVELEEFERGLTRSCKGLIRGRENGGGRELCCCKRFGEEGEG